MRTGRPRRPFWSFVEKTETCWLWRGVRNREGYGFMRRGGRTVMAHRYAYEMEQGPIPPGLVLDHLCRVTHCVNPAHLEPVTDRVNILRGFGAAAQNAKRTECAKGHPLIHRRKGYRRCLICYREWDRLYHQRLREERPGYREQEVARTRAIRARRQGEAA